MEKFNRAVRRHHIDRLKQKRKFYWGYRSNNWGREPNAVMAPDQLGKVVQYPQACSCSGCGNQRKYEGRPHKERCDFITMKEEVDHVAILANKGAHDEQNETSIDWGPGLERLADEARPTGT